MRPFFISGILILAVLLPSCHNNPIKPYVFFGGKVQGTYYQISYYDDWGHSYQSEIEDLLECFDSSVSVYLPSSLISRVNNNETLEVTDTVFKDIFRKSMEIYKLTAGAFDITVGPLVNAWGFGFKNKIELDNEKIDSLLQFVGSDGISLLGDTIYKSDQRMYLDFNAIAQGYSVDMVADLLEKHGVNQYLIDIGGEVLAKGLKPDGSPWRVGIEKPVELNDNERQIKAILALYNSAIATSGSYRKFYVKDGIRYSHTINPLNGYPVTHSLLSASVLSDECAIADGFATAFMVMGLEKSLQFIDEKGYPDAFFIYSDSDGKLKTFMTEGFEKLILEER